MQNPIQEPPASSKTQNQDLKDMYVLCTFKIQIESQNSEHWCIKDQHHILIMIKMLNSCQEAPASSKATNQDFKDMYVGCTFKIKKGSQNLD